MLQSTIVEITPCHFSASQGSQTDLSKHRAQIGTDGFIHSQRKYSVNRSIPKLSGIVTTSIRFPNYESLQTKRAFQHGYLRDISSNKTCLLLLNKVSLLFLYCTKAHHDPLKMMEAPSLTKRTAIAFPYPGAPVMMAVFLAISFFWGFLRMNFIL